MIEPVIAPNQGVIILTDAFRIEGRIHLLSGVRMTDYMNESKAFMAVIDATVATLEGREVLKTPFLNIRREAIQAISPAESPDASGSNG